MLRFTGMFTWMMFSPSAWGNVHADGNDVQPNTDQSQKMLIAATAAANKCFFFSSKSPNNEVSSARHGKANDLAGTLLH